jgi:hypothetical protein
MHLKMDHSGLPLMHPKVIKVPATLTGVELHCCMIMAFVDIFIDVLNGFDRRNALNIDMTAVLPDKPFAVWYDPAIVDHLTMVFILCSSITMTKNRVRVLIDSCLVLKGFWKRFGAASIGIFDAWSIGIACTWSVDHILLDQIEEFRFSVFVRKFSRN